MNQTSSSPSSTSLSSGTDFTSLLTSAHLIWIAIFAAVVIAGIVYGARLKRRRTTAERRVVEHAEQAGVEPQPAGGEAAERAAAAPVPAPQAAAPTATPAPTSVPAPPAAAPAPMDAAPAASGGPAEGPVTQLKGLGPKVAARLADLGITTIGQLAALDHDAAARLDADLGSFRGRMERDRWIEQARFLAAGDVKGFEAVFGRL